MELLELDRRCIYRLKLDSFVVRNLVHIEVVLEDGDGIWVGWVDCSILWRSRVHLIKFGYWYA